jgi:hypothetical protein
MAATAAKKTVEPCEPMRLLERLIKASWNPKLKQARPVVFDMTFEKWTLDPASTRSLVSQTVRSDAALTIHASAESLMRALSEPSYVLEDLELIADGDVSALDPIISALTAKQTALSVRMAQGI